MIYTIQLNQSGTHSMEIMEQHLETIRRHALLKNLIDSNGLVTEDSLDKLKLTLRSMIAHRTDCKDLLDLCIDIIYHNKMKAYGLSQLIKVYQQWEETHPQEEEIQEPEHID